MQIFGWSISWAAKPPKRWRGYFSSTGRITGDERHSRMVLCSCHSEERLVVALRFLWLGRLFFSNAQVLSKREVICERAVA